MFHDFSDVLWFFDFYTSKFDWNLKIIGERFEFLCIYLCQNSAHYFSAGTWLNLEKIPFYRAILLQYISPSLLLKRRKLFFMVWIWPGKTLFPCSKNWSFFLTISWNGSNIWYKYISICYHVFIRLFFSTLNRRCFFMFPYSFGIMQEQTFFIDFKNCFGTILRKIFCNTSECVF